jgi:hypothetical protein
MTACTALVKIASADFSTKVPSQISSFTTPELPKGVSADDMVKVYTQKFAHKEGIGRIYYNDIRAMSPYNICPLCNVRQVSTLDHYLPKTKYPLLVVTPLNLIPCCRDCNFDKSLYMITTEEDAPLHPYFDDISDVPWLAVQISADQSIIYYVDPPISWTNVLAARARKHMKIYNLQVLYGSHAIQEINDSIYLWREVFQRGGHSEFLHHLSEIKESVEHNDLNSWKAALYRGLIKQIGLVEAWL